jgi:hypothetical protein
MQTPFRKFLPHYFRAHGNRTNQLLHFTGASLLLASIVAAAIFRTWWPLPAGIFAAYLLPHIGHKYFEGNASMRASAPVFCVLGAGALYLRMWKRLLGRRA